MTYSNWAIWRIHPVDVTITNIGNNSTNAQYVRFLLELNIPDSDSLAAHRCALEERRLIDGRRVARAFHRAKSTRRNSTRKVIALRLLNRGSKSQGAAGPTVKMPGEPGSAPRSSNSASELRFCRHWAIKRTKWNSQNASAPVRCQRSRLD